MEILFYKINEVKVNNEKCFIVTRHLKLEKCIRTINRKNEN